MIEYLRRASQACARVRFLAYIFGTLFLGLFVYSLFSDPSQGNDFLVPSSLGILWSILFYSASGLFLTVPEPADNVGGFFRRLKRRLHRFLFYSLGAFFIALTLVVLFISGKLAAIWIKENPFI